MGRQAVSDVGLDDAVEPGSDGDAAVDVALVGLGDHLVDEGKRVRCCFPELLCVVDGDGELRNGAGVRLPPCLQLLLPHVRQQLGLRLLQPGLDVLEDGLVNLDPDHVGQSLQTLHLVGAAPELEGPVDSAGLLGVGEHPLGPRLPLVDQGEVGVVRLTHGGVVLAQHEPEHQQVPGGKANVLPLADDLPVDGGHVAGDHLRPGAGQPGVRVQLGGQLQQVRAGETWAEWLNYLELLLNICEYF